MGRALSIVERTRKTRYFSWQGSLVSQNPLALAMGSMSKAECAAFGVDRSAVEILVKKYGANVLAEKLWLLRNARRSQTIQNEAGWLLSALKHNYAPSQFQDKQRKKTEEVRIFPVISAKYG